MTSLANSAGVFTVCCVLLTAASLAGGEDSLSRRAQWSLACPPGQYVSCYDDDNNICPHATCWECPPQTFSEREDHAGKCADCTVCRGRRVTTSVECTPTANTRCDCEFGYFAYRPQEEGLMCVNNTTCKHGILRRKSPDRPFTCEMEPFATVATIVTSELPVSSTTPEMTRKDFTENKTLTSRGWSNTTGVVVIEEASTDQMILSKDELYIIIGALGGLVFIGIIVCVILYFCCSKRRFYCWKHTTRTEIRENGTPTENLRLMNNGVHQNDIHPKVDNHLRSLQNGMGSSLCAPSCTTNGNLANANNRDYTTIACQESAAFNTNSNSSQTNCIRCQHNISEASQPQRTINQNVNDQTQVKHGCTPQQAGEDSLSEAGSTFWMPGSMPPISTSQPPVLGDIVPQFALVANCCQDNNLLLEKLPVSPRIAGPVNLVADDQTQLKEVAEVHTDFDTFDDSLPTTLNLSEVGSVRTDVIRQQPTPGSGPPTQAGQALQLENIPAYSPTQEDPGSVPPPSIHYNIIVGEGGTVNLNGVGPQRCGDSGVHCMSL